MAGFLLASFLIKCIALFLPRVTVVVVATGFPEAGDVAVGEFDFFEPLGGFPEVEMGDKEARWSAVFGFDVVRVV